MSFPFSFLILKTVFKTLFRRLALCQIFFGTDVIRLKTSTYSEKGKLFISLISKELVPLKV